MRDSGGKGVGMRGQDPPFQTLLKHRPRKLRPRKHKPQKHKPLKPPKLNQQGSVTDSS